jgi:ParB family chromosome partitioning protein
MKERSAGERDDGSAGMGSRIRAIPIDRIVVPEGRREPRDVESLAESIRETKGLVHAIAVTEIPGAELWRLVAGRRRLAAYRLLGWTVIPAQIVDAADAELIEIDENLMRAELTALERCEQLARRQEIYEEKHPETKHGGAPANRNGKGGKASKGADSASLPSFVQDAATKIGASTRTVHEDVQIAKKIGQAAKARIRGTPLEEKKTDLLALSREPEAKQVAIVEAINSGEAGTVAQGKLAVERREKRAARDEEVARRGLIVRESIVPCLFARADAEHLPLPDGSVDLVLGSPPYIDARTYYEDGQDPGIARGCRDWVPWMLRNSREAVRVSRGLVLWVLAGKTDGRNYQPGPEGLMWEWYLTGGFQECPCYWYKVGIPGSGHDQCFRKDVEYVVAFKGEPVLPWADNTANGHPPRWAPGGAMSYRVSDGTSRNQFGHSGTGEQADRRKDGSRGKARRSSHTITTKRDAPGYEPPVLANPGNMIVSTDDGDAPGWASSVLHINTGGGFLGWEGASENEAPFPQSLAEWFIRSHCPPGGIVLDPFSGSGSTVRAALALGRCGIGLDIRRSQCELGIRGVEDLHRSGAEGAGR